MTASIQQVTATNIRLLDSVDPDVFDHAIQPARLEVYLADPRHAMFVAVDDRLVVGQVRGSIHLQPDRASDLYIDNLGTAPSHQRRGIATAMIAAMLDWGKAQGCSYAWVATEIDNAEATGFYASQSFALDEIAMFGLAMD